MSITKKRISLTIDSELYNHLKQRQKATSQSSLSATVIELTKEALELEEDAYFAKIASQREKEGTISHKSLWKANK